MHFRCNIMGRDILAASHPDSNHRDQQLQIIAVIIDVHNGLTQSKIVFLKYTPENLDIC